MSRSKAQVPPNKQNDRAGLVSELADELALAFRLNRPSLLIVITTNDTVRDEAQSELAIRLKGAGHSIRTLDAATLPDNDVPMAIRRDTKRKTKVFFVENVAQGGANALRALNTRREYFTDLRARVVFWLSPAEELALAQQATDFWTFRHRTVYLS